MPGLESDLQTQGLLPLSLWICKRLIGVKQAR
jgi:hypothetical protein